MKKYIALGVAILFVIGCGTVEPSEDDVTRLNDNANGKSVAPTSAAKKTTFGAGDWELGTKEDLNSGVITEGTYIITTPEDGINCYYVTVKNFDKRFESIIANGNISPGETARVVVKKTYAGLTLDGDCLAKKQVKN